MNCEIGEVLRMLAAEYDRAATQEWYARYEGPFEEVGQAVNDGYLKGFGQQEGVRSYGLVVDYLIAWHQLWDTRG